MDPSLPRIIPMTAVELLLIYTAESENRIRPLPLIRDLYRAD